MKFASLSTISFILAAISNCSIASARGLRGHHANGWGYTANADSEPLSGMDEHEPRLIFFADYPDADSEPESNIYAYDQDVHSEPESGPRISEDIIFADHQSTNSWSRSQDVESEPQSHFFISENTALTNEATGGPQPHSIFWEHSTRVHVVFDNDNKVDESEAPSIEPTEQPTRDVNESFSGTEEPTTTVQPTEMPATADDDVESEPLSSEDETTKLTQGPTTKEPTKEPIGAYKSDEETDEPSRTEPTQEPSIIAVDSLVETEPLSDYDEDDYDDVDSEPLSGEDETEEPISAYENDEETDEPFPEFDGLPTV